VLIEDDDFDFQLLGPEASGSVIADNTPPFRIYPANANQVQACGNPFAAAAYRDRYSPVCASASQ
jgi:hypothetical protein